VSMGDAARIAVYLDFDNIVISRYDNVHGVGSWRRDDAWKHPVGPSGDGGPVDEVDAKLESATIDLGAIIDYATGFGTVALTRAVDLVQLFAASGTKNGADIRLAVDAVEDLFQHDDISHVLIVAGDSDYVPLAQRCKRMGRYVVGVGVTGSTSSALVAACDEFTDYARLPGITPASSKKQAATKATSEKATAKRTATKKSNPKTTPAPIDEPPEQSAATSLLLRAVRVLGQKSDDEWLHMGGVKSTMQRMDPGFKEKSLGYSSFVAFVDSRSEVLETRQLDNGQTLVRPR